VRFISSRANRPYKFHFRVEVWTSFNEEAEAKVQNFRDTFVKDFFTAFAVSKVFKPVFMNNEEKTEEK
jgi:hypothetical protein